MATASQRTTTAHQQKGFIGLASLLLMLLLLAVCMATAAALVHKSTWNSTRARLDYLNATEMRIANWYVAQAGSIDAISDAVQVSNIKSVMGASAYGVQVASTQRLGLPCDEPNSPSCIGYHDIYVWLPPASSADGTTLDAVAGTFNPDAKAQWIKVSGKSIEAQLMQQTTTTMATVQGQLRSFFAARAIADADVASETNYFRDASCATTYSGSLPCVDTFTNLTSTAILSDLGLDTSNAANAWGLPLQVSNQADSSMTASPFSMALRSATPWGSSVEMAVVQPN